MIVEGYLPKILIYKNNSPQLLAVSEEMPKFVAAKIRLRIMATHMKCSFALCRLINHHITSANGHRSETKSPVRHSAPPATPRSAARRMVWAVVFLVLQPFAGLW